MANKPGAFDNSDMEKKTSAAEDTMAGPEAHSTHVISDTQDVSHAEIGSNEIRLENVRASVVARLHELEVATQRLSKEKQSLEHQLMHVLERLVTEPPALSGSEVGKRRAEAREFILQTVGDARPHFDSFRKASVKAPIAKPDYSGLRETLAESSSAMSVIEYSSLSDTYEAICLQRDMVHRMYTSESSRPSDNQEFHDVGARWDKDATVSYDAGDGLVTSLSGATRLESGESTPNANAHEKERQIGPLRNVLTQYVVKDAQGTTSAETLRVYRAQFPFWLSHDARTRGSEQTKPLQPSGDTDSVRSSLDSCSIFSSSPSSSSPPSPLKTFTPRKSRRFPNSMPASPLSPKAQSGHHRADQLMSPKSISSGPIRSALHAGYPKTQVEDELNATRRRLCTLPGESIELHRVGPPKVRISRRKMVQITNLDDSSDTSATSHRLQPSIIDTQRINRLRGRNDKGYFEPYRMIERMKITPPFDVHRSPELRLEGSKQQLIEVASRGVPSTRRPPIHLGPYTDFFNSPIRFGQYLPSTSQLLYETKDLTLLRVLSKLINGMDAFTCNQSGTLLLERVTPPFVSLMPILSLDNNHTVVNHSHESSDLTSEFSIHTGGIGRVVQPDHSPFRDTTDQREIGQPEPSLLKQNQMNAPRLRWEYRSSVQPEQPEETQSKEAAVPQREILLRLSNRVKIWRRYQAELNPSSLLLFATDSAIVQSPEHSIALSDVQHVRKQPNFSASITMGLVSPGMNDRERTVKKHRMGSVPVTRKFPDAHSELGRTQYNHFEVLMNDGKTHRFRGLNATHTDAWMRRMKRALRAVRAIELVEKFGAQLVAKGWLLRIKGSEVGWVWCRLMSQYLVYSQRPDSLTPTGYKSLEGTHIRTVSKLYSPVKLHSAPTAPAGERESDTITTLIPPNASQLLTSSSDSDTLATGDADLQQRTISLWSENCDPVYLVCQTQQDFETWRDHLIRACQSRKQPVTEVFNANVAQQKLLEQWRSLVKGEHMYTPYHTNELIRSPLSKTTEMAQTQKCKQLFACLLFLSYPKVGYQHNGEEFVRLPLSTLFANPQWLTMKYEIIKHMANVGLNSPGLKDELFLQLIKQATLSDAQSRRLVRRQCPQRDRTPLKSLPFLCGRRRWPTTDSTNGGTSVFEHSTGQSRVLQVDSIQRAQLGELSEAMTQEPKLIFPSPTCIVSARPDAWWSLISVWECLCLLLPLFLPSLPVLVCLELLINLHSEMVCSTESTRTGVDIYNELSRYAAFCKDALKQTIRCGGRSEVPSALEVASISIRNPYTHTYPFSIPIHLPNGGTYEVISFNGGSELRYVVNELTSKLKLPMGTACDVCIYGIYLRVTGLEKPTRYLYLEPGWKLCDVLSLYEQAMLAYRSPTGVRVTLEEATAELVFRIQAFSWKRMKRMQASEVASLVSLLTHQLHGDLLSGSYPVVPTGDTLTDLVAYLCRADHLEYAELKRRKEFTLSQLIHAYFPPKWIADLAEDGRSLIQLKLLLIDRWSCICKTDVDTGTDRLLWERSREPEFIGPAQRTLTDTIKVTSCFAYLRLLRSLLPGRFGTLCLPVRVYNTQGVAESEIVWIVPQESQLTFMSASCVSSKPGRLAGKPSQPLGCIKAIPYNTVLSFGCQKGGSFFLVYYDRPSKPKDWRKRSVAENLEPPRSSTRQTHHPSAMTSRSPPVRRAYFSAQKSDARKLEEFPLYKLRMYLTDLHSLTELTSTLDYFINLFKRTQ